MFEISVKREFSSAHKLVGYQGVCQNIHGHNWKVKMVMATDQLNEIGIGIDFKLLDDILDQSIAKLDHQLLNDVPPFDNLNPTAENLAKYFFDSAKDQLPDGVKVAAVEIAESDNYVVTYRP